MIDLILVGASALGLTMFLLWIVSIYTGNVSFIDAFWGTGFLVATGTAAYQLPVLGERQLLAIILLILWGARLSMYLLRRYLDHGEDPRYIRMTAGKTGVQRHFFTAWFVFGLQGVFILAIGAPIFGLLAAPPGPLDFASFAGSLLWLIGVIFEWTGDYQLSQFRKNSDNASKVLDTGLWAWTRHPNYFGDACVWWGLWFIGHDWSVIYAPALMTFLLLKWSGVPLLEKSLKKRRPDYAAYCERTSNFFPLPPKPVSQKKSGPI